MGGRASGPVPSEHEVLEITADTRSRKYIYQRNKEYHNHRPGSDCRHSGTNDTGHDAGGAIHHRTTECAGGAAHELPLLAARCKDQPGAYQ